MRIAFIVGRFPVLSEAFILNQITGLIDRGHEVDIYALEGYVQEQSVHPNVSKYRLMERVHSVPQMPENRWERVLQGFRLLLTKGRQNPLLCLRSLNVLKYGKEAASLRLLYAVIPFLRQTQPYDIIHAQFGIYGLTALLLRDLGACQGKLVTSFRGYDISWFVKEKGDHVYDQLFEDGDFFLTNCNFFRNRAIHLGCEPAKIIVHGSGINCQHFAFSPRHPSPDGITRITTTGRLIEKKGIEYAIRAIAQVVETHPKIEYNIVGDGYLMPHFQHLIQALNISEQVKLLGWKNQQELAEILNQSHLFIAPSVTAADGNQDAPVNTLKEAMAMGLPVIGTVHGGIPELIEDGISGFLVPERDANAIANKLITLMENPERWPTMGRAGRDYVEKHYDMNQLNDELVTLYRQVTSIASVSQPLENPVVVPVRA